MQTKHASEPVIPPQAIVDRVPQSLSAIILKMIAKKPSDRYATLDGLITALEEFLGITRTGPFTPREEHATLLEQNVTQFNASKTAKLRHLIGLAFHVACAGLFLIFAATKMPIWAGGTLGLWVLSEASYFGLTGITQKNFVFRKVRQYVFGFKLIDWVKWGAAVVAFVSLLWMFKLLWVWLGVCFVAVAWTAGLHFVLDRKVTKDRQAPLEAVRDLLKGMRLRGLDEDAIRRFVCKYSGRHWEPMYEALFGYEAKMTARSQWGTQRDDGKSAKKYAIWRDGLISWINCREREREQQKQRAYLRKIEREKLKAQGMDDLQANNQAKQAAQQMVAGAEAFRQAAQPTPQETDIDQAQQQPASPPPVDLTKVIYGDEDEDGYRDSTPSRSGLIAKLLGAHMRLIVGLILVTLCVLWMYQNDLFPQSATQEIIGQTPQTQQPQIEPLALPGITLPSVVASVLSSYAVGFAGVLLIVSSFLGGTKLTFYLLPGLTVLLGGQLVEIELLTNLTTGMLEGFDPIQVLGGILCFIGLFFGRSR